MVFLVAMIGATLIVPGVIALAKKTGAMDKPDPRKVHKKPVPRIGGVAIYLGFMVSLAFFLPEIPTGDEALWGLVTGGTLIFLVGLLDDYRDLPAKVKLVLQILVALVLSVFFDVKIDVLTDPFGDYIFLDYMSVPVTVLWLVGITNTVNLIDGLDGLAAGVSSLAAFTICLVAVEENIGFVAILTAALCGSAVGFLYYNFNPARIFMGDSGSMFLGFMLASVSIVGAVKSAATIALIVPILALGLPIMDTAFAIVRRYLSGVPIFKPDRGHLHHRLLDLGFTQRQAVLLMYVVSALLGTSAVALTEVSTHMAVAIIVLVLLAVFYGAKRLGIFRQAPHA